MMFEVSICTLLFVRAFIRGYKNFKIILTDNNDLVFDNGVGKLRFIVIKKGTDRTFNKLTETQIFGSSKKTSLKYVCQESLNLLNLDENINKVIDYSMFITNCEIQASKFIHHTNNIYASPSCVSPDDILSFSKLDQACNHFQFADLKTIKLRDQDRLDLSKIIYTVCNEFYSDIFDLAEAEINEFLKCKECLVIFHEIRELVLKFLYDDNYSRILTYKDAKEFIYKPNCDVNIVDPVSSFIGRVDEIEKIRHHFTNKHLSNVAFKNIVEISGMIGIGKTELVRSFIKTYKDDYCGVVWVDCNTQELVRSSFIQLIHQMEKTNIYDNVSIFTLFDKVITILKCYKILFVFDNCNNFIDKFLCLSETNVFDIILIKRDPTNSNTFKIKLDSLNNNEALYLTNNELLIKPNLDDLEPFVDKLTGIPLVIQQAVSYINSKNQLNRSNLTFYTCQDYLLDYENITKVRELLTFKDVSRITKSIFETWNITFDYILSIDNLKHIDDSSNETNKNELKLFVEDVLRKLAFINIDNTSTTIFDSVCEKYTFSNEFLFATLFNFCDFNFLEVIRSNNGCTLNINKVFQRILQLHFTEQEWISMVLGQSNGTFNDNDTDNIFIYNSNEDGIKSIWSYILQYKDLVLKYSHLVDKYGRSGLHYSVLFENIEMMKLLLEKNPNLIDMYDVNGNTAIFYTLLEIEDICQEDYVNRKKKPNLEVIKFLKTKNINLYHKNNNNITFLNLLKQKITHTKNLLG